MVPLGACFRIGTAGMRKPLMTGNGPGLSTSDGQKEWDQVAHLEQASKGEEPRMGSADPFPFTHDPWYSKLAVLLIVFLPLAGLGYAIWRLWGHGIGPLQVSLLASFWAFTGLGISVGS